MQKLGQQVLPHQPPVTQHWSSLQAAQRRRRQLLRESSREYRSSKALDQSFNPTSHQK